MTVGRCEWNSVIDGMNYSLCKASYTRIESFCDASMQWNGALAFKVEQSYKIVNV